MSKDDSMLVKIKKGTAESVLTLANNLSSLEHQVNETFELVKSKVKVKLKVN